MAPAGRRRNRRTLRGAWCGSMASVMLMLPALACPAASCDRTGSLVPRFFVFVRFVGAGYCLVRRVRQARVRSQVENDFAPLASPDESGRPPVSRLLTACEG